MLEIKNTVTEMKNVFDGPIRVMLWAEEIVILKICQWKLPKLKTKKKKDWNKTEYFKATR